MFIHYHFRSVRIFLTSLTIVIVAKAANAQQQNCPDVLINKQLDLFLILDSSTSIHQGNFTKMLEFIQRIVQNLDIGQNASRVGAVQYTGDVKLEFHLNQYFDKNELIKAIKNIAYQTGVTHTGEAIKHVTNNEYTTQNGARPNIPRVAVVITDGWAQDDVVTASNDARAKGIQLIAVGISRSVNQRQLLEIAGGSSSRVFYLDDFESFNDITDSLVNQIYQSANSACIWQSTKSPSGPATESGTNGYASTTTGQYVQTTTGQNVQTITGQNVQTTTGQYVQTTSDQSSGGNHVTTTTPGYITTTNNNENKISSTGDTSTTAETASKVTQTENYETAGVTGEREFLTTASEARPKDRTTTVDSGENYKTTLGGDESSSRGYNTESASTSTGNGGNYESTTASVPISSTVATTGGGGYTPEATTVAKPNGNGGGGNGDIKDVDVRCDDGRMQILVRSNPSYKGWIFVKGHFDDLSCRWNYYNNTDTEFFLPIKYDQCGVQRSRSSNPRGVYISVTLAFMKHAQFLTQGDKAYRLQCFYTESDKQVTGFLDVSMLATETITKIVDMPACQYSLRADSLDGPVIKATSVGRKVVHRWDCEAGGQAEQTYGMKVHSCFVSNAQKSRRVLIIDEMGCAVDRYVLGNLNYSSDLLKAYVESEVFKFADSEDLLFDCQISLCLKQSGACNGYTPPVCQEPKRGKREISVQNVTEDFESRENYDISSDIIIVLDLLNDASSNGFTNRRKDLSDVIEPQKNHRLIWRQDNDDSLSQICLSYPAVVASSVAVGFLLFWFAFFVFMLSCHFKVCHKVKIQHS